MTVKMAKWALAGLWIILLECLAGGAILAFTHHWIGSVFLLIQFASLAPSTFRIAGWIDANRSRPVHELKHNH